MDDEESIFDLNGLECRKIPDYPTYGLCMNGKVVNIKTGKIMKQREGRRTVNLKNDDGIRQLSVRKLLRTTFEDKIPPEFR